MWAFVIAALYEPPFGDGAFGGGRVSFTSKLLLGDREFGAGGAAFALPNVPPFGDREFADC